MAIIKCKMCGGDLEINENSTVFECEYCGTRQTVPSADNEKKLTLFGRAGRLLRGCEFDKAAGVFESIVADFPEEAEAYWGLVLCKYGIEYVDDPATGKKVPTCHRSSFDNVMKDPNFEQACENTDAVARRVYRDEARAIEELRRGILNVSDKEEPYDVFISYKEKDENGERTPDSVIAQDIYRELTREGYRVFFSRISLEDKLGTEYEPYIFAALNSAKVMIVVGTDYENFDAVWVKNEWSRYLKLIEAGQKKTLIPVFRNMDAYDMPEEFNRLAALDMGKVGAMQDLVRGVEKIVGKKNAEPAQVQQPVYVSNEADAKTAAAVKRGNLALEDGEYDKATEFFNQALTLNAECAEAYFGMALAEAQCRSAEEYINRAAGHTPDAATLTLPKADEHIQGIVTENNIPRFFEGHEIRWHYSNFDLSYSSDVEGQKTLFEQEKQAFESNRNVALAFRFAKGQFRETLDCVKNALYSALEANTTKAEQKERKAAEQKEREYRAFLEETDKKIADLHQKKLDERENTYQSLCKDFESSTLSHRYRALKDRFQFMGEYKDCEEYVHKCDMRAIELEKKERAEQEEQRKERLYNTWHKALDASEPDKILQYEWETAKQGFESLGDYKDSPVCAEKCAQRITEIKREAEAKAKAEAEEAERQRVLAEKAEKEHRAKQKKIGIIFGVIVAVAIVAVLVVTTVIIPGRRQKQYAAAEASLKAGQIIDAYESFLALGEFKDSSSRADDLYVNYEIARMKEASVGDIVIFGFYEQDNDKTNGTEAVEWLILEKDKDQALIISKYALDAQEFHHEYSDTGVTWETCSLRQWLNSSFLNEAFSTEEQLLILETTVRADKNPKYYSDPGNDTSDRVFLLSIPEVNDYFSSDSDRQCIPTSYAVAKGATFGTQEEGVYWGLRTPGDNVQWMGLTKTCSSAGVDRDGSIRYNGLGVAYDGVALRPAMWIDLGS